MPTPIRFFNYLLSTLGTGSFLFLCVAASMVSPPSQDRKMVPENGWFVIHRPDGSALLVKAAPHLPSETKRQTNVHNRLRNVAQPVLFKPRHISRSDSDTVKVKLPKDIPTRKQTTTPPDTIRQVIKPDSTERVLPDSMRTASDTLRLVPRYLEASKPRLGLMAHPNFRRNRPFSAPLPSNWKHDIQLDSLSNSYLIRDLVGNQEVRYTTRAVLGTFLTSKRQELIEQNFRTLSAQRTEQRQSRRSGGFSLNYQIPGGQNTAFTTIFGKPEVDLRVTGHADIDAGFERQTTDDPSRLTPTRTDPLFKQNLRLGVRGTVGDKLSIDVNWDTQRQFEYENQLRLVYTGYEDEIIKRIEAGNVTLDSRSSLINGGRSLFGIRTDLKLGGIDLTVVASQQKGNGSTLELEGGAESEQIKIRAFDYEDNTHYFMGYYFRSQFESTFSSPPTAVTTIREINRIEVWKQNIQLNNPNQSNLRQVVAFADLGEPRTVVTNPEGNHNQFPDGEPNDPDYFYTRANLNRLRDGQTAVKDVVTNSNIYQEGPFQLLRQNVDYSIDQYRGFITLTSRLSPDEALAVAYEYTDINGNIHTVGDLTGSSSSSSGGGLTDTRLVLKLLRRQKPQPTDVTWPLTLRNIYRLPASNLMEENFKLRIQYDKAGQRADEKIPGLSIPNEPQLLEMLGLDRISRSNYNKSDTEVDFDTGTLDARNGRIIFPYLEPFGRRIRDIIEGRAYKNTQAGSVQVKDFAFDTLYTAQPSVARTLSQYDIYNITGSASGGVQSSYNLGFALVEGSVRVFANNNELSPADFTVNYEFGNIEILNPAYLTPGNKIRITYERQQFTALQQKNLFGVRASYNYQDRLLFGATAMRLKEKPNTDKYRIGQEPIANRIWGFDGSYNAKPRWLTRAIDALPLIQTRAESSFDFKAEFAHFSPENAATLAFERTQRELKKLGRDFAEDERSGEISYIDDFEGIRNPISLANAGNWTLSSAPDSLDNFRIGRSTTNDSLLTTWRARMGWANIGYELYSSSNTGIPTSYAELPQLYPVLIKDILPNYDVTGLQKRDQYVTTLNLFFDPTDRGPFNYATDFDRFINRSERKKLWGGMIRRLPEAQTDFTTQNIEFIEFIFSPYTNKAGPDAKMVINLGSISEDVLPNARLNTEDGLSTKEVKSGNEITDNWGRISGGTLNNILGIEETSDRRTEDLGLDGLSSYDDATYGPLKDKFNNLYKDSQSRVYTEQTFFKKFLDAINPANSTSSNRNTEQYQQLWQAALADPSGDDFRDFRDEAWWKDRDTDKLGRFNFHFPGSELNSPQGQRDIWSKSLGSSKIPDSEDLNQNNNLNLDNNYYQYEIPLDITVLEKLAKPEETNDYIITKTAEAKEGGSAWYKVSIPIRDFTTKVGNISGFNLIQAIRIWLTGFEDKGQIRFSTFELVGSQWRESKLVGNESVRKETPLVISSLSSEEDAARYATPTTAIVQEIRNFSSGSASVRQGNERAMALSVTNLQAGDQRAVYKTFTEGLDLLKYRNIRMFTHIEGRDETGRPLRKEDQNFDGLRMFIRLGSDENKNYYEYELPVTPYELAPGESPDPDKLWQMFQKVGDKTIDLNSMHVKIPDLISLKSFRDQLLAEARIKEGQTVWSDTTYTELIDNQEKQTGWSGATQTYLTDVKARLAIKGNPTLSRLTSIVIGIRNNRSPINETGSLPNGKSKQFQGITLWANELRVTEYDALSGNAGLATANIRLADFATVSANANYRDEGFGALDSQLGSRSGQAQRDWGITTNVNLHKLLPERFGWNIPFNYSIKSNVATPRFLPDQGDLPLKEKLAAIEENTTLDAREKQDQKAALLSQAETVSFSQSLSVPITKSNSQSPMVRYLLDPLSVSYRWSEGNSRNPQTRADENWQWGASASYSLNLQRLKTIRPFRFIPKDLPVLGGLNTLRLAYLPQNIKAAASTDRSFRSSQQRPRTDQQSTKPDELAYPFRETHDFGIRRTFDITYNPLSFLSLSYRNETSQTFLSGLDSLFYVKHKTTRNEQLFINNRQNAELAVKNDPDNLYLYERIDPRSTQDVIRQLFTSQADIRADRHGQDFSASFDPKLDRVKWLDWVNIQPITYNARFDWDNGNKSASDIVGAGVSNTVSWKGGTSFRLKSLYDKVPLYKKAKQADQQDRTRRQQQARERREANEIEARKERARREAAVRQRAAEKQAAKEATNKPAVTGNTENPAEGLTKPEDALAKPSSETKPTETTAKPIVEKAKRDTTKTKKNFNLPLPDPKRIARYMFLKAFSISDLSFNYSRNTGAQSGNLKSGYYLFGENITPWNYRFGLTSYLPADTLTRVNNTRLQISDQIRASTQYGLRGSLELSQDLRVDLTSDVSFEDANRISYKIEDDSPTLLRDTNLSGKARASAWAIGANYNAMVQDQFNKLRTLQKNDPGATNFLVEDGEQGVLTNQSVGASFRKGFITAIGSRTFDKKGYLPIPLPNWNISYNGLQRLPFLSKLVQSATLRHGYSTSYDMDYRNNPREGKEEEITFNGVNANGQDVTYVINYALPGEEVSGVRINERFSPLIEMDLRFKNGIQATTKWAKSNAYTFGTTNYDLSKIETNEFEFRTSYSKTGMTLPFKLPFMKTNRLNNTIRFSFSIGLRENKESTFPLKKSLEQALRADYEATSRGGSLNWQGFQFEPTLSRSQRTLDAEPRLSYQFSARVTADAFLTYSNRTGKDRTEPNLSTLKGGFNFRVSISN